MSIRDILITGRSARLPGDYVPQASEAEIKHAAQFAPGAVTPGAVIHKSGLRARGRVRKRSGEMNKTEAAFAVELDRMRAVGEIIWWQWDCVTLRLADRTHYHPDFAVLYADGLLRMIDTKGSKKTKDGDYKPFCEEDAKLKLKVVAEQFPIVFAIAYRLPIKAGGGWRIEDV
jgi:hypothetical protein